MSFLHIVNANFELELEGGSWLSNHPIFLQLQFLPLLYAEPEDGIGVTHAPYPALATPRLHLLDEQTFNFYETVESWGASPSIAQWAKKHRLKYATPDWDVVKHVNSKAFSYAEAPQLPGSALIHSMEELSAWIEQTESPRVLKSCFGMSGRGHLLLPADPLRLKRFAEKELAAHRPLIGEPWVDRKLDFSTQWFIHPDAKIDYLGATTLVSDKRGSYHANKVGDLSLLFGKYLPFLDQHKNYALPILQKMAALGYFGNVGVDAMIWGKDQLHPIVEINARKTMGWVALQVLKHRFPKQTIALSYLTKSAAQNLLPDAVMQKNGSVIRFSRKLVVVAQ